MVNNKLCLNNRVFIYYAFTVSIFLWAITAYRASITGITYDEAFTYLNYSKSLSGFLRIELANNHPINSLLIYLFTKLTNQPYNELTIRLPNIIAFAFYLFICYKVSLEFKYPFLTFSLLSLNYYLDEFFGLARGYGISTTFVITALYFYLLD